VNKEFPELQKLLQLRGRSAPGDEYFEEFLDEFHRRQRQDLLKRSARSLLLERLTVWFREMGSVRWVYAAGAAYVAVLALFVMWPKGGAAQEDLTPASRQMELIPEEDRLNIPPFEPGQQGGTEPGATREF
jgi:hypothetical protein